MIHVLIFSQLFCLLFVELDKKTQPETDLVDSQLTSGSASNKEVGLAASKNAAVVVVKEEPVDEIETIDLLDSEEEGDPPRDIMDDPLANNVVLTQKDPLSQHGM